MHALALLLVAASVVVRVGVRLVRMHQREDERDRSPDGP
jgi:hypothetical protein